MEEQQYIRRAADMPCARVHLARAAARGDDDVVGMGPCEVSRAIRAAAIDDDDAHPARSQRLQFRERPADAVSLIEHRNDDCKAHVSDRGPPTAGESLLGGARTCVLERIDSS